MVEGLLSDDWGEVAMVTVPPPTMWAQHAAYVELGSPVPS